MFILWLTPHEVNVEFLTPGAESDIQDRDPAAGELSVHQQAGEGAAATDVWAQPATRQEQVPKILDHDLVPQTLRGQGLEWNLVLWRTWFCII